MNSQMPESSFIVRREQTANLALLMITFVSDLRDHLFLFLPLFSLVTDAICFRESHCMLKLHMVKHFVINFATVVSL